MQYFSMFKMRMLICIIAILTIAYGQAIALPLDKEKSFAEFVDKLQELSKEDQIKYCEFPFIAEQCELGIGDNEKITFKTKADFAEYLKEWTSLIENKKSIQENNMVLVELSNSTDDEKRLCYGFPHSECLKVYLFQKRNNSWRITGMEEWP